MFLLKLNLHVLDMNGMVTVTIRAIIACFLVCKFACWLIKKNKTKTNAIIAA